MSDVKEAVNVVDGVPRKTIDTDSLGVNAFANDVRFGSNTKKFAIPYDYASCASWCRRIPARLSEGGNLQARQSYVGNLQRQNAVVFFKPALNSRLAEVDCVFPWLVRGRDQRANNMVDSLQQLLYLVG